MSANDFHTTASGDLRPGLSETAPILPIAARMDFLIAAPVDTLSEADWAELAELQERCRLAINEAERLSTARREDEEERRGLAALVYAAPCAVCGEENCPKMQETDWCDQCEVVRRLGLILIDCGIQQNKAETLAAALIEHHQFTDFLRDWLDV